MNESFFFKMDSTKRPGQTTGYTGYWNEIPPDMLDGVLGDKEIYSSTGDLFKLDQALYTDKLVSWELLQEAWKPRSFEHPGAKNYGYGFRLLTYTDSTKAIYHNGWWHGYNSVFFRVPQDGITIIILCNKKNMGVYRAINGILEILRGKREVINMDDNPGV
jgi:CubicO group peptidase (beta-lactamase class C family)